MVNLLPQNCTRPIRSGALPRGSTERLCFSSCAVKEERRAAMSGLRVVRHPVRSAACIA